MIDYKKLGRILDSSDQQKLDQLINVNIDGLISQYDEKFIKHGFVKVDNNKYNLKMSEDSKSVFQITKNIALTEIDWLLNFRGGSFTFNYNGDVLKEAQLRGVTIQTINASELNNTSRQNTHLPISSTTI